MLTLKDVDHTALDEVTAESIPRCHYPVVLKDFQPMQVVGHGNYIHTAVSLGMFGSEDFHLYLDCRIL